MKTAIWILSIILAIAAVVIYKQWQKIQSLTQERPDNPAAGNTGNRERTEVSAEEWTRALADKLRNASTTVELKF